MSFIGSMVAVGVLGLEAGSLAAIAAGAAATGAAGAGLGAGISALTGGDPGQGALIGGIGGALGGAGAGLAGAGGAAAAGEGAALAGTEGAAITGTEGAVAGGGAGVITTPLAESAPIISTPLEGSMSSGVITTPLAESAPIISTPLEGGIAAPTATQATGQGTLAQALGQTTPKALPMSPVAPQLSSQVGLQQLAGAEQLGGIQSADAMSKLSLGQQAVQRLTGLAPNSAAVQYGGSALQGMASGAGIQGISNAISGRPITEGMGTAALAGGVGGAATTGLASQAGSSGILGTIGKFATEHPYLTAGGIGMLMQPTFEDWAKQGEDTTTQDANTRKLKSYYRFNPATYRGYADGGMASGIGSLGGYSDGGQLLKGPGDGVSDSIPATINGKTPARLADGEFVVPARIVSELGNGSTEAGAKQLYGMLDRIQNARSKSMGKGDYSVNSHAAQLLPA